MDEANKLRVMLIDDMEPVRRSIARTIADIYDVHQYGCFSDAKKAIPTINPDILLMDIKNRQYHGHQFLEDLLNEGIQIPTVVITGSDLTDNMVAQAVYRAQKMYNADQLEALGIENDPTLKATKKRLERLSQVEKTAEEGKTIQPYFLQKPPKRETLRDYLDAIAKAIKK